MKIGWIADNFYPIVERGAEIEDKMLIEEGERRGHEIVKMGHKMGNLSKDVEMFIVANRVDKFNIGELLSYLSRIPYVNLEHDLRSPHFAWYKTFAQEAILNVFHSPLHAKLIEELIGKIPYFLHPMCISPNFKDLGFKRLPEQEVLYVGDYAKEKGYKNMETWLNNHPDCKIWHVGGGFEKNHPRMVELGIKPQEKLPEIYNTFSSLIFLPAYTQACSRIIAEAYLCKIPHIIHNGQDGFTSYNFGPNDYDRVREMLVKGAERFWKTVEERS